MQRLAELAESRGIDTGVTVAEDDVHELLEATTEALRVTYRELEDISWRVVDRYGQGDQDAPAPERRNVVKKARLAWKQDPQAGAYVSLMNDFALGRGIPKPRCKDELVQEIVDEAWDDPDNKRVLTTFGAQLALNTDLSIQCNVFVLGFDDGKDGRFKLGLLQHDAVEAAVRDPENYLRVLYYVAKFKRQRWDFVNDRPAMDDLTPPKTLYYEAWGALDEAMEERESAPPGADMLPLDAPPPSKMGRGKVYHLALNRTTEMVFGWPEMARTIRWFSAYNDLMAARVDVAKAVASLIMKRKIKGTPDQLARTAAKYLSRESPLAARQSFRGAIPAGPANASIVTENENVTHEPFNLDSRSANAQQDSRMIGAQVSAGHRFPRSYFGDQEAGSLATATSLELPVLKAVEARQEVLQGLVRWFIDAVIEKAVDDGRIPKELTPEELAKEQQRRAEVVQDVLGWDADTAGSGSGEEGFGEKMGAGAAASANLMAAKLQEAGLSEKDARREAAKILRAAGYQDSHDDENSLQRDLSYDFNLPSPLRRQMQELITAVTTMAQAFDPDNTNVELSRALLTVGLTEGLEVNDAADIVEKVFPPGYKTMAQKQFEMQASAATQQQAAARPNPFGPESQGQDVPSGPGGQAVKPGPDGKPPNGIGGARPAEMAYPQLQHALMEGRVTRRRDGTYLVWPSRPPLELEEADGVIVGSLEDLPEDVEVLTRGETREQFDDFDRDVTSVALDVLKRSTATPSTNGNGG